MKKIILVLVMFTMFIGVVSAASFNGDYKGNPIVKVYNNNIELRPDDVPALIYNGRTVVPISMLKKLGAQVTWNPKDYSVFVELPTTNNNNQDDIAKIKMYAKVMDNYRRIGVLGDILADLSQNFSLAFDMINSNNKPFDAITSAYTKLDSAIDNYNSFINSNSGIVDESYRMGIDTQDTINALNQYSKSIDYYKISYEYLDKYRLNKSNSDFQVYLDNSGHGFDTLQESRTKMLDRYYELYSTIQNY